MHMHVHLNVLCSALACSSRSSCAELHSRIQLPSSRVCSDASIRKAQVVVCNAEVPRRQNKPLKAATLDAAQLVQENTDRAHPSSNGTGDQSADEPWAPEDFVLPSGALSSVARQSDTGEPGRAFRCTGCTRPECQDQGCTAIDWSDPANSYLRQISLARVYEVATKTRLEEAPLLSAQLGNTLLLKREDQQQVFSFKLRGAYNKMRQLTREELSRGVICSSAGNHAQGVALAAAQLECNALICMPTTTPEIKVDAVRRLGGTVHLHGESYTETQTYAQERAAQEGRVFIAPYDDPYTIAGQGTVGKEILEQCSDPTQLHAIFVPIGGGGLIAGIAAYVKALAPNIKVIGVEPTGANAMAISLVRGRRTTLSKVDAFADGVAVKTVGKECFRLCQELVDGVVLVSNAAISGAIRNVFDETRTVLEAAGALAVAGARAYLEHHDIKGATVVAVTSGANLNFDRLRLISELAEVGARREAMLATTIPEERGRFLEFVETALADTAIPITEFKYRYSAGDAAHILFSIGIQHDVQLEGLMKRLQERNFQTLDLSAIEAAQVHLRHLVGGRARSYTGKLPDERIYQVDFPERPGALLKFLRLLSATWNISLFHYRQSGNRSSTILLGLQLPEADQERFDEATEALGPDYTFNRLDDRSQTVFDMFIS